MKVISFIFLLLTIFGCDYPSQASDKEITFVFEDFPPYEYQESNSAKGIHVEIVKKTARRIGVTPDFLHATWKKANKLVKDGNVNGIFSLTKNPEREKYLYFSKTPISTTRVSVYTKGKCPSKLIKSFEDLKGKVIGVVSAYTYGKQFDDFPDAAKTKEPSNDVLAQQFKKNWRKTIIMNDRVFEYYSKKYDIKEGSYCNHPPLLIRICSMLHFPKGMIRTS